MGNNRKAAPLPTASFNHEMVDKARWEASCNTVKSIYNAIVFRVTTTLVATCSVNPRYRLVPRMVHARPNKPSVGQAIRGVLRSDVSSVARFSIGHSPYRLPRRWGPGAPLAEARRGSGCLLLYELQDFVLLGQIAPKD